MRLHSVLRRRQKRVLPLVQSLGLTLDYLFRSMRVLDEVIRFDSYRPNQKFDEDELFRQLRHVAVGISGTLRDTEMYARGLLDAGSILGGTSIIEGCRDATSIARELVGVSDFWAAEEIARNLLIECEFLVYVASDVRRLGYDPSAMMRQIHPIALRLTTYAVQMLPRVQRPRYCAEFRSELYELGGISRRAQVFYAMRLFKSAWALRRALVSGREEAAADL